MNNNIVATQEGQKVIVSTDPISPGDQFVLNNPHPTSSLKNVIRTCHTVEGNEITVDDRTFVRRAYPQAWCRKIIGTATLCMFLFASCISNHSLDEQGVLRLDSLVEQGEVRLIDSTMWDQIEKQDSIDSSTSISYE